MSKKQCTRRVKDVERIYDYDSGEFRLVRLDAGETIEQRPLRGNERQVEFPGGAA